MAHGGKHQNNSLNTGRVRTCQTCKGTGKDRKNKNKDCFPCQGKGYCKLE